MFLKVLKRESYTNQVLIAEENVYRELLADDLLTIAGIYTASLFHKKEDTAQSIFIHFVRCLSY